RGLKGKARMVVQQSRYVETKQCPIAHVLVDGRSVREGDVANGLQILVDVLYGGRDIQFLEQCRRRSQIAEHDRGAFGVALRNDAQHFHILGRAHELIDLRRELGRQLFDSDNVFLDESAAALFIQKLQNAN